jgi:putative hemolysin
MNAQEWIEVVVLVFCFLAAALAAGTETALTSVGRLRVRFLAEQGSRSAAILQKLRADPNRYLSTVLFTNTLALIVASTSTTLLTDSLFTSWGVPVAWRLWLALAVSFVLSVVLLIAAEVTPKTLAIRYAERVALWTAGPVDRLATFLGPILWAVTLISRALTGGRAARAPFLTEEELLTLLHVSEEAGVIEEQEHQMIHGIIEIGDKTVREIMIPRTDIVAIEKTATLKDIVKVFKEYRHTRTPVYEEDLDHIVGLLHAKDLLLFYTLNNTQEFDIAKILRPIKFTPEQKKVDELLHEMRTETSTTRPRRTCSTSSTSAKRASTPAFRWRSSTHDSGWRSRSQATTTRSAGTCMRCWARSRSPAIRFGVAGRSGPWRR